MNSQPDATDAAVSIIKQQDRTGAETRTTRHNKLLAELNATKTAVENQNGGCRFGGTAVPNTEP